MQENQEKTLASSTPIATHSKTSTGLNLLKLCQIQELF